MICTTLTSDDRGVLLGVRSFLTGMLRRAEVVTPDALETIGKLDRLISRGLTANSTHDAGAYARCSGCGRYTINPNSLGVPGRKTGHVPCVCDCGRADHWCGSFVAPGEDARFAVGLPATRDKRASA